MMKPTTLFFLITLILSTNIIGSCQTNTEPEECPDTSYSQTNLDTLEAQNPKFVWRICNANSDHAMENLEVDGNAIKELSRLSPCTCSQYFSLVNKPIERILFHQDKIEYSITYLSNYGATKGLTDNTSPIYETPGRYTYHFDRDTTERISRWIEIEREAYYE